MKLISGIIILIALGSCNSQESLQQENERLKLQVMNLQAHANALQQQVLEERDKAEAALKEALLQKDLALVATQKAQILNTELAKCKNQ